MPEHICASCGGLISECAFEDPYTCRNCEKLFDRAGMEERYAYLYNYY